MAQIAELLPRGTVRPAYARPSVHRVPRSAITIVVGDGGLPPSLSLPSDAIVDEGQQAFVLEDLHVLLTVGVGIDRLVAIPQVDLGAALGAVLDHLEHLVADMVGREGTPRDRSA